MSVSLSTSSLNNENTLERECLTAFVQASALGTSQDSHCQERAQKSRAAFLRYRRSSRNSDAGWTPVINK